MVSAPFRAARSFLVAAALFAMPAWGVGPAAAQSPSDKTLVIARDMDLNSLDPGRAFCDTCQLYIGATYQRLVNLSPDNKSFIPELAKSWEFNDTLTEYTFHLDPNAKFSDGSPVEAKDVKWSWERLKNLKGSAALRMTGVTAIETPDTHTVVVKLAAPDSDILAKAADAYTVILNSDVVKEHGGTDAADANTADQAEKWLLTQSAGSGPYVLESYKPNSEVRLKRNENFWGKQPFYAGLVLKQSKDAVSQMQMLQNGDADLAMQIDMQTVKTIDDPKITVTQAPSLATIYLALSPGAKGLATPLAPKVREAIALAIDYEKMIEFAGNGAGKLQPSPLHSAFFNDLPLPEPKRDVEKAKALLAEAGVPDGFKIVAAFPAMNAYGVDLTLAMQLIQQNLADIGVEVELQPVTFPVFRERITGDGIPMTVSYAIPGFFGPSNMVNFFAMMPDTVWAKRAHAERDPSIINPKEAEIYKQALAATGEKRDELYHQLAGEMTKDRIIIPLINPDNLLVHRAGLKGVRGSVCCLLPVGELSE
ncbi:ABC transporter substrate-binding protein [Rhodoligotrophos ferricapiens]|uniref:ABC transporter substrate-binding protein n=1 Tax=Rhodoligotrophos ferricapiens TaxID=3069264 RepID=UPI00315CD054